MYRPAAVAGAFYPAQADALAGQLSQLLAAAKSSPGEEPKALVVPHAGYIYSGGVAAESYSLIPQHNSYDYILLLGPSHRVPLRGMAVPSVDAFATPLGRLPLESGVITYLLEQEIVELNDDAHKLEHCLEVQLPFLQAIGIKKPIVPITVGYEQAEKVAELLTQLTERDNPLIIISTDLSHFHDYESAVEIDNATTQRILKCQSDIKGEEACGCMALNGLLLYLKQQGLKIALTSQCNSGDTAGGKDRVVGYGAYVVY